MLVSTQGFRGLIARLISARYGSINPTDQNPRGGNLQLLATLQDILPSLLRDLPQLELGKEFHVGDGYAHHGCLRGHRTEEGYILDFYWGDGFMGTYTVSRAKIRDLDSGESQIEDLNPVVVMQEKRARIGAG